MEQLCVVLWLLITGLAVYIPRGVTWLLANVDWFAAWWTPLANWKKYLFLSLFTLTVGGAALATGLLALHCAGWPEWTSILYLILVAVASYWNSGKSYEQKRRRVAEKVIQMQKTQLFEMTQKASNLSRQLEQLQKK